jgi:hypothetical protein
MAPGFSGSVGSRSFFGRVREAGLDPLLAGVLFDLVSCRQSPKNVFASAADFYHHALFSLPRACGSVMDVFVARKYFVVSYGWASYVYGLASDGKVFVNRVDRVPRRQEGEETRVGGDGREVVLIVVSDSDVKEMLGYESDAEGEEVTIERPGRYRIQGDLCMGVEEVARFYREIERELLLYKARLAADAALRILLDSGIAAEARLVDAGVTAVIVPAIREYVGEVADAVVELLKGSGLVTGVATGPGGVMMALENGCTLSLTTGSNEIAIVPACLDAQDLGEELQRLLGRPRVLQVNLGNHHIVLHNALSANILYIPSMRPLALSHRHVNVNLGVAAFIAGPDTTITITHPEHGMTTIKLAAELVIRFYLLERAPDHAAERNVATVKAAKEEGRL